MAAQTIQELQVQITAQNKQFKSAMRDVYKELGNIDAQGKKIDNSVTKSFSNIGKMANTALKVGVVGAIAAITASIPSAVKRVDTLNNSARTFENMGFKSEDASKAVKELEKSITGLPTPLDSAIRGMTSLAATYGDVKLGQQIFSALNNAILGFGGSAAEVDNAIQQLSQLPMDGPLDAQTWNSLRNSGLTPVLVALAKDFGMSVSKMKEAFGDGSLTVGDFTKKLTEMNEKGGGGLKSLQQIARDSTKGIGRSFANRQTAITRAVANVIKAFGPENFSGAINGMAQVVDQIGKKIVAEIPNIQDGVRKAMGNVFECGDMLKNGNFEQAGKTLGTAIGNGITGAIKAMRIGMDAIKGWFASINWGEVGIAVGTGALAFVAGLVLGLFSEESLSQFIGFIADNWFAVIVTVLSIALAPTRLIGPISKAFSTIFSKVPFGTQFAAGFGKVITALRNFFEPIRSAFHAAIVSPITSGTSGMINVIISILKAVVNVFTAPFRLAVAAVADSIRMIPPVASAVVGAIKGFFAPIVSGFISLFSKVVSAVVSAFSRFSQPAASAWGAIRSVFGNVASWFGSAFQSGFNRITSIFGQLRSWFGNINLFSAGQSLISGFVNGVKSMIGAAKDAAARVVQSVRDFFPFSPAKEGPFSGRGYTTYSGKALMGDFQKGITLGAKGLDASVSKAIGPASKALSTMSLPSYDMTSQIDMKINRASLSDISGRQIPVRVDLDGDTLLNFFVDGVNGRSYMTNSTILNI